MAAVFFSALIFSSSDFSFLNFKFISKDLLSIDCVSESDEELRFSFRAIGSQSSSGLGIRVFEWIGVLEWIFEWIGVLESVKLLE
jgi:hypothetical protein